jgi:hypothetical protein
MASFDLKLTGSTFHGEAHVIADGKSTALLRVNPEQPWSAEELRKVAALLQSAAAMMEA